jgi:hypothetical protein
MDGMTYNSGGNVLAGNTKFELYLKLFEMMSICIVES